jgi:hypothetical protein
LYALHFVSAAQAAATLFAQLPVVIAVTRQL